MAPLIPRTREHWVSVVSFIDDEAQRGAQDYFTIVPGVHNGGDYGCGDCCHAPMNSDSCTRGVASDGGAWFINDEGYGEPNGDWSAGCFLHCDHLPSASQIEAGEKMIYFYDYDCPGSGSRYVCSTNSYSGGTLTDTDDNSYTSCNDVSSTRLPSYHTSACVMTQMMPSTPPSPPPRALSFPGTDTSTFTRTASLAPPSKCMCRQANVCS